MTEFFEEVEEQLRSDRYRQIILKAWPWVVGGLAGALVIALAVWGYQKYVSSQEAKASQAYAAAMDTLQRNDLGGAYLQFGEAAKSPSRGYKALALMQQGAIRLQGGKTDEAVKLFDQAASVAPDNIVGDMGRLKSAFALMDTAPYAAMQERLKPLTDAKRPYHAAAREALAMAELKAGRLKDARGDFVVLTLLGDVPQGMRQRAQAAIAAIDSGAAAGLGQTVKAALELPPMASPPPGAFQASPQAGPQAGADQ